MHKANGAHCDHDRDTFHAQALGSLCPPFPPIVWKVSLYLNQELNSLGHQQIYKFIVGELSVSVNVSFL